MVSPLTRRLGVTLMNEGTPQSPTMPCLMSLFKMHRMLTEFREKSTIFAWNTEDLPGSQEQKNHNVRISLSFKMLTSTTDVPTALVIRQTNGQLAITVAGRVLKER